MRDAQKPEHISLNTLIGRLREGRFVIPDFQRDFEWRPGNIKDLIRSVFLDYYIGSLLVWKGKKENFDGLSCETLYGFDDKPGQQSWNCGRGAPEHIVLDGQQRLTALYYAFVSPNVPLPGRATRAFYFVNVEKFMNEEYDEAFQYEWSSARLSETLATPTTQYDNHMFPLSVVGSGGWNLYSWVQGYENHWKDVAATAQGKAASAGADMELAKEAIAKAEMAARHAANGKDFGEYLKGITEEYQIAYIELDRDLALDKVCDIFTQINSKGIRLDIFDLVNALLKPKGIQLKHMWRVAAPRLAFAEAEKMNVYVLQVMSILCQSYCSPKYLYYLLPGQEKLTRDKDGQKKKDILVPNPDAFMKRWDGAVLALEQAIKLLKHPQEFGVSSSGYLPYVSILPVFAALQTACGDLPPNQRLKGQRKIRHWYWASVFNNRYSGSVESTSTRDFLDVKAWMTDDDAPPALIQEFHDRFHSLDLRKEVKKGTSVYNGIFNLLVLQGARDWVTGNIPQQGDLDDHHIVPQSKATDDLKEINVQTILNRTPLTAATNRLVIRDRLPNEYLAELISSNGEANARAILDSHFISPTALEILLRKPFGPTDYEAFIAERQRTILAAIEDQLIKERLYLAMPLRELDRDIEAIELGLRECVTKALADNPARLPPHVSQKLNEMIQRAAKKNAAVDAENYKTLSAKLEFADLRELQDAITSKAEWEQFEPRFMNKETLSAKFGQLAELRNGIRHSRTIDGITRKEGEAAILWFKQVLGK
jgi:hypothetical protein